MNASAILFFVAAQVACAWTPSGAAPGGFQDAYAILEDLEQRRGDYEAAARSGRVEGYRLVLATKSPEGFVARSTAVAEIVPALMGMRADRVGLNVLNEQTAALIAEHVTEPDEVLGQWQHFSLVYSGDDVAVRTSGYLPPQLRVWRGGEEHLYDRNAAGTWGQVSLFSKRRGEWMETPERFLFLPDKRRVPRLEVANAGGGRTITNGRYTLVIDDRMRILRETMILDGGRYLAERFQQDFKAVPLGDRDLTLPHAIGTLGYSSTSPTTPAGGGAPEEQRVRRILVHLVTAAEFGVEIKPDEFRIAAPAGTTVADFRNAGAAGGSRRPHGVRLQDDSADVVDELERGRLRP